MNSEGKRWHQLRVVRSLIAASLLLILFAVNIPFAVLASQPSCALACCVGLASHAAGSCLSGSCHLGISVETQPRSNPGDNGEPLCGAPRIGTVTSSTPTVYADFTPLAATTASGDQTAAVSVSMNCQPDCGTCASGTVKPQRQRAIAVLQKSAYGLNARTELYIGRNDQIEISKLRHRPHCPRGPPALIS